MSEENKLYVKIGKTDRDTEVRVGDKPLNYVKRVFVVAEAGQPTKATVEFVLVGGSAESIKSFDLLIDCMDRDKAIPLLKRKLEELE